MKKELTRRSFLKLAGVGALAVAMSGSLTGCDVIDNLKDMDSVSAAIGDVKFMMSASAWTNGVGGQENDVTYQPTCEIRNNSKKAVTYGGSGSNCEVIITGVLTDKNGKEYPMTYVGENGSAPAGFLRFAARRSGHPAQRNGRDFGILAGNVKSRTMIFKAALPNGYIGVKP